MSPRGTYVPAMGSSTFITCERGARQLDRRATPPRLLSVACEHLSQASYLIVFLYPRHQALTSPTKDVTDAFRAKLASTNTRPERLIASQADQGHTCQQLATALMVSVPLVREPPICIPIRRNLQCVPPFVRLSPTGPRTRPMLPVRDWKVSVSGCAARLHQMRRRPELVRRLG